MKKLQIGSLIFTAGCLAAYLLWRVTATLPDWLARVAGVGMLIGIAVVSFSTARVCKNKK
ncbi:MAG: hypothetical protein PHI98_00390 [Eubacteriales bacterium]|nr:hypothetical protein [Eubacteriales bacterium]